MYFFSQRFVGGPESGGEGHEGADAGHDEVGHGGRAEGLAVVPRRNKD